MGDGKKSRWAHPRGGVTISRSGKQVRQQMPPGHACLKRGDTGPVPQVESW